MLFEVHKGAILALTDSEWRALSQRDIVLHKGAIVLTVPDGSTAEQRADILLRVLEEKRAAS